MSEKVKLPKKVCDALCDVKKVNINSTFMRKHLDDSWDGEYNCLNELEIDTDLIINALVLGYEPELSAEEQVKELWNISNEYVQRSLKRALKIHGIHYDWMEDAK